MFSSFLQFESLSVLRGQEREGVNFGGKTENTQNLPQGEDSEPLHSSTSESRGGGVISPHPSFLSKDEKS